MAVHLEMQSQSDETLWTAAASGNLPALKHLVEQKGLDPNQRDDDGNTPLHCAADNGDLRVVRYLAGKRKCSPECSGQCGRSPLHNACACTKNGNLGVVKYLVEKHRCDPYGKDEQGNTPLNLAAEFGNLNILIYLIEERKCSPRCPGQWGRSTLHNACQRNDNLAMVKYLVEKHGCDPVNKDEQGNTALNLAAAFGNLNILIYFIEERKCSPACPGQWGRLPLHNACKKNGNLATVKYLVEKHECDPLATKDQLGNTPLNLAAIFGSLDILIYLIEEMKCSPRCPGQWARLPLHHACIRKDNLAMVKYLVEMHGCDPVNKDEQGNTPLNLAAAFGNLDILIYFIEERKCSPACPGQWGRSPLHNACEKNGNLATVKYLVEKQGCDPVNKDEQGNTALNVSALSGSLDILIYLIKRRKYHLDCPGKLGRSPLHNACAENDNLAMVKYLVENHGCDPSRKDEQGNTALNLAALSGSLDILIYLIEERKCSPGCPGQWGRSPLHYACLKDGNLCKVKYLVEKLGCDPNGKDEKENSPINLATASGSLDILIYLIEERKCSPEITGTAGRSLLHQACENIKNLLMVKYLVEKHGCDPYKVDKQGNTPLNVAALSNSLNTLIYLIEERKCSPGCLGQWGRSPLHQACGKTDNLAMVKYLVEKHGCDPSRKDEQGNTPLNVAAFSGSLEILVYLIDERMCSSECLGLCSRTLLHNACEKNGNLAMVKYLVEKHGCDPSKKDEQGNTALNLAALSGSLDILIYFIEERKCSPGCPGQCGRSPLHRACEKKDNLTMVKYLVEKHGCDPSKKDEQGNTPLNVAAFSGSLEILMYLIDERNCSSECLGLCSSTLLHNACENNGNLAMVKYLVEKHGCDLSRKNEQGNTPLHLAAFSGSLEILMYLIDERMCSSECLGLNSRTLLHIACEKNGNLAMVKHLVEKRGCDLSRKDEQGNSPLNVAAFSGSLEILTYLIDERMCSSECLGRSNRTLLHNACEKNGNLPMVKYLVEKHGCDLSRKDEQGNNPLNVAAFSGSLEILMYLIEERKCSPGCTSHVGRSLLHDACEKSGNLAMVKYLVERHGCDPYGKDEQGNTPLNVAALSGSFETLVYLIDEKKCSAQSPGQWGRSPLHNACEKNGNLAMVKYLVEKHGCDPHCRDQHGFLPLDHATNYNIGPVIIYLRDRMGISVGPIHHALPPGCRLIRDNCTRRVTVCNELGIPVEWNHPDIKNDLGFMPPDWCPAQISNGSIVFVNASSGVTVPEDPRTAVVRYENALKDGYILASFVKILIIGAAGVGKTHLLHMLFNDPPPDIRQSTPVMERPVQAILTALKPNSTFCKVTNKELYELLAHTVNTTKRDEQLHEMPSPTIKTSTPETPSSQSTRYDSVTPQLSATMLISEVTEQLIPYIARSQDAPPLRDMDWLYFIDSGGQPQFHQLLPAFMHHTNLNICVFKLCDKLSDHPTVEYYDERGTCISSTASLLTNKEILQCCAQATQTADQSKDSRLIIVGTHRDLQCDGETMEDKNEHLLELLTPSMKDHLTHRNRRKKELIFPLNTKQPDETDRKVVKELCKSVLSIKERINQGKKKIPLRWLVFHQEIQSLSKSDLLSFEECCQVASRLNMVDDTAAALKFFSDLNVILYYQDILPNVIFTNPQSLLNIVTRIIKHIVYETDNLQADDPLFVTACEEGIISVKLLDWMKPQIYKPSMFEAHDLIGLLLHLRIVSKYNDDYFMPSLLRGLDTRGIEASLSIHPDSVEPCAVYYEKRWLECGAFGFLITSLLSSEKWTLASDGINLLCVHSNCIKLFFHSCVVTLVDHVTHIEIHVNGENDICQICCPEIKQSVLNANTFKMKPQFGFVCPCSEFKERHVASFTPTTLITKKLFCSKNRKTFSLSPKQELWISGESSPQLKELLNDVASHIPAKWRSVGIQLLLPSGTLDSMQAQNAGRPDDCILSFEQVFIQWERQKTSPHTWETIINALRAPAVSECKLADGLLKYCI